MNNAATKPLSAENEFEELNPLELDQACGGAEEKAEKGGFLGFKPLNDDDKSWLKWYAGGLAVGLGYMVAHKRMHAQNVAAKLAAAAAHK